MGDTTPVVDHASHPDEGGDSDVWAALTRGATMSEWGGQPAECAVRRKLLAKTTRGLGAVRATQLAMALPPAARTEMLSAGGPGCGSTWTIVPHAARVAARQQ